MDLRDVKEFCVDSGKYIITVVAVLFAIVYVVSIQQVVGPSMSPTLESKDILVLNKIHYKLFDIKRFDIISFEYDETKYLIKRVIGLPGETVEYKDNKLYINNELVEEEFLNDTIITDNYKSGIIPEDMYVVLGDNRTNSLDSREFGFVSKNDILGKINIRFFPITKIRYVK